MDSNSKHVNQNSGDIEDSEQVLGTKIQNEQLKNELKCLKEPVEENRSMLNDMKSLKESHDLLMKKFQDLEKLVIQNKTQIEQGMQSNRNSGNDKEPNFENPFCFEQPLKKIKLEDQSEEIQRLNLVIKDLKEENLKLSNENAMLIGNYVLTSNTNALFLRTTMPTRPTVAQTSTPQQQVIQHNVSIPHLVSTNSSPATKSIVATPLAPGQQIPPGTTVFTSGGKTYCIPKASMTVATQQPVQQPSVTTQAALQPAMLAAVTPTLPVNPQQQLANVQKQQQQQIQQQQQQLPTLTIGTVQTQNPSGQKQMIEIKSLDQNTITLKGNQMIVSGPDTAQAQLIAKQLSSGAARLATLNGKQVLISTLPTEVNQQQQQLQQVVQPQQPAVVPQLQVVQQPQQQPVTVMPLKTDIPNNVKEPSEPLPPNAIKKDEEPKPAATAAGPKSGCTIGTNRSRSTNCFTRNPKRQPHLRTS